ncbi:MAG TPA: amino acid adenylation domain-containing protein, partial [Thermoanaerobaculia bacterium]|nr:amino acid adenylation domain-containing protein [Thermoanaerobaculia bacterium]
QLAGVTRVLLDADWPAVAAAGGDGADLAGGASPDDLAYVIYTSGSTGRPKGAMNSHRAICNRLLWMQEAYGLTAADRVLQKTPFSFDVSVWELFWPLMTGACLVMARPEGHKDGAYLTAVIAEQGITTLHFVPSMLQVFLEEPDLALCGSLRRVIASGEALPLDLQERFFARLAPAAPGVGLHNLYGPTEAAVDVTFHACQPGSAGHSVPIGRPIANLAIHLLDAEGRAVPTGVAGELHLGGVGLARGYLRRPDLTADRFVPHPFAVQPGERLYRTGDLARHLPSGAVEYLGRTDHQVKVRGFRIELGEIEAVLAQHPGVREAVVLARRDHPGEVRLVAYFVPQTDEVAHDELRGFLRTGLPEYMVPSFFVALEALPLLPNGKADRGALARMPAPDLRRAEPDRTAPRTPVEETLAAIWREALRLDYVGVEENFFELGGDSILSIQVVSRAARAGLRLTPRQIFEHPTVAALAAVATAAVQAAEEESETGEAPLTPIQRWFFEQDLPRPGHFNQALMLEADGRLDPVLCDRALGLLLSRHDALRLRYTHGPEGWRQAHGPESGTPFSWIDLSALPVETRRPARAEAAAALQASLDLTAGPLMRATLMTGEPDRLLLIAHHLVIDGVSWRVLLEDLETAYRQEELPPRTASFRRWAERLSSYARSTEMAAEAGWWLARLAEPVPALPMDGAGGEDTAGSASGVVVALDEAETRALLTEVPRAYRTQINDVLLAALARALAKWTGSPRVRVDLEGHGREELFEDLDVSRTVGWFTALYPVALGLADAASPGEALKTVKEQLRAVPRRGVGYGLLRYLDEDGAGSELARLPRAQVVFNYLGQLDGAVAEGRLLRGSAESAGPVRDPRQPRPYLLEINGRVAGGRLSLSWIYNESRHRRATVEAVAADFLAALRDLIAHCLSPEAGGVTPSDFPLARLDQAALDRLAAAVPSGIEDLYPATAVQQGMLFHSLHSPESGVYVEQVSLALEVDLDAAAFEAAWRRVAQRHAVLRTAFAWLDLERPLQVVHREPALPWERQDWRDLPAAEQEAKLAAFLAEDRRRGFDVAAAPLMRFALFRLGDASYRFVWTHHHILLDGWSLPILLRELFTLYAAGDEARLDRPRAYRDYVAWLERQDLLEAERFWREDLAGLTAATPLVVDQAPLGEREQRTRSLDLPAAATEELRVFARRHHLTLNTLLQGAWALLLHRYSAETDVVFGAVASGRSAPVSGIESIVGLFINTLPARAEVAPRAGLTAWLQALQERQARTRHYEHSPLAQVQAWSGVPRGQALFESILAFENYPVDESVREQAAEGLRIREVGVFEQTNYPLTLVASARAHLSLRLLHDARRFDAATVERMLRHLETLLVGMSEARTVEELPLLTAAERHELLVTWNDTRVDYRFDLCLHEWIEAQVDRTPDAVAVTAGAEALTYRGLDRQANRLAHRLLALGCGPESRVGLLMERSAAMMVALVGVLKAGASYVPLDPEHPADRLAYQVENSGLQVVLTQPHLLDRLPEGAAHVVVEGGDEAERPAVVLDPDSPAYALYTSGSTGRPMGAVISHRAIANRLLWMQEAYGLTPADRVLQKTPFSFDVSVWEFFWPLMTGARLVMAKPGGHRDNAYLVETIAGEGITVLHFVPSMLQLFLVEPEVEPCRSLRDVMASGEALPAELVQRFHARSAARLHNLYGPTEAAVDVTFCPCDDAGARVVPIGRPIANTRIHLLDPWLRPVPAGVPGELYIGGVNLARGYVNRPDLTADRFVPDPVGSEPGARLYRTGDLARHQEGGAVEYLGRTDFQVKVRGLRIELGEIEAALLEHPAVRQAVVVVRELPDGHRRLVAYLAGLAGDNLPGAEELRASLVQRLPEYMVPALFVALPALPLTSSGKVDRRALPAPEAADFEGDFEPPQGPVEEALAAVWSAVLGVERVGRDDGFFALG